jgi:hypothetical protein
MNAARRKQLDIILAVIEQAKCDLDLVNDAEQEAFGSMPESIQTGAAGEKAQTAIEAIDEAMNWLDEAIADIETAKE